MPLFYAVNVNTARPARELFGVNLICSHCHEPMPKFVAVSIVTVIVVTCWGGEVSAEMRWAGRGCLLLGIVSRS